MVCLESLIGENRWISTIAIAENVGVSVAYVHYINWITAKFVQNVSGPKMLANGFIFGTPHEILTKW